MDAAETLKPAAETMKAAAEALKPNVDAAKATVEQMTTAANTAFKDGVEKTLAALAKDKAKLRQVLLYHVVSGNVKAAQVVGLKSATTLAKQPVRIAVRGGVVYLNRTARVVKTDIAASNGVIHVVNTVLIPPA
jgi:uncharacterized surface protein with fasciclin (FAS1) repeats